MSKTSEKSAEIGYFHAYGKRDIISVSADFQREGVFHYVCKVIHTGTVKRFKGGG